MAKDKDQNLELSTTPALPIKPNLNISWSHPDLRLSKIIQQSSALGYSKHKIAEIVSVDIRTMEYHYRNELNSGRELLSHQLMEVATREALSGNEKLLKYLLDKVSPLGDPRAKGVQPEEDTNIDKDEKLQLKNLTVKELKELRRLMNKAKEPLDGKVE